MAIKINTLEMLLEELDQDLQWRKKRNIRYKDPYNSKTIICHVCYALVLHYHVHISKDISDMPQMHT